MWALQVFTCWVQVDAFHFRFHIFTLAAAVIEWGICWLLILLELIAGSGGVVFAMFSYSIRCIAGFHFFMTCTERSGEVDRALLFDKCSLKEFGRIIHFSFSFFYN